MCDIWQPYKADGFKLFDTPPDVSKLILVPFKPVDTAPLHKTFEILIMKTYLPSEFESATTLGWWNNTLAQFEAEDAAACKKCAAFRKLMNVNGQRKADDKELAKIKGAVYKQVIHIQTGNLFSGQIYMFVFPVTVM